MQPNKRHFANEIHSGPHGFHSQTLSTRNTYFRDNLLSSVILGNPWQLSYYNSFHKKRQAADSDEYVFREFSSFRFYRGRNLNPVLDVYITVRFEPCIAERGQPSVPQSVHVPRRLQRPYLHCAPHDHQYRTKHCYFETTETSPYASMSLLLRDRSNMGVRSCNCKHLRK